MSAQMLLENFELIASAPGGVKRLREMIYHLGVTGALCKQDPTEGNGILLLAQVEEEKQNRMSAGTFKRSLKLENLRDTFSESLPVIPKTWAWTRLVDIGEISPRNEAKDDVMASFAAMSVISDMHGIPVQPENRPWETIKKGFTHFANGDVVVAKITPCFENGKAAVIRDLPNGVGAGTTELHVVRPLSGIESTFIYIFLRSPYFKAVGEGHMTGTAGQKRLPSEYLATRPFPLPPTAEQKRIVAKVDELMALCDKLEAQQQERERRFPVLSSACHARFVESPTLTNLKAIFDEAGSVSTEEMRNTILNLAVKGNLVQQYPTDEPAEQWLLHFQKRNTDKSTYNRTALGTVIGETELLPDGWITIQLDQIFIVSGGIQKTPQRTPRDNAFPYLGVANVYRNRLDLTNVKKFELEDGELERYRLETGDLLIIEGNGSIDQVGRCAQWSGQIKNCVHQNHIIRCRPIDPALLHNSNITY